MPFDTMERIVRPFVPPGAIVARRIVATFTQVPEAVSGTTWGGVGDLPSPTQEDEAVDESGISFTVKTCSERLEEQGRQEKPIRIQNPDDPSQYVMWQRPDEIKFKKKEDDKMPGAIRTQTTTFADINLGYDFDVAKAGDDCNQTMALKYAGV